MTQPPTQTLSQALAQFDTLDASKPSEGDALFERYGPGNKQAGPEFPYERFEWYRELLVALCDRSPGKYGQMHKGTPFYFMAWLAFDFRDFERALTYLDAAVSEDARIDPKWYERPGGQFLMLDISQPIVGERTVSSIRHRLQTEIQRFANATGSTLTLSAFLSRFVSVLIRTPNARNIVSAFYVFLLEADDRYEEMRLRSIGGGSTGPAISLLFRGGILLESVLKHLYPGHKTLGAIFNSVAFKNDFALSLSTSAGSLRDTFNGITGSTIESALTTTARLRNTTGHNLVWDDIFSQPGVLQSLVEQELNALFFIVDAKFP